ncbi:MAG: SIMPL domain-containing protein [Pseudomonadota bacterium]|nr:SIMPL domain-containing protein [Pseudomonadota bacterium]
MRFRTLQLSTAAATALCALLVSAGAVGAEAERPRTISVSGQGEVQAEPDRALLTLGIESRKLKMEDARAEVAKSVEAVLKLTRDLKIDQKYVRTTRINIQPEYNWDNNARERNLIGYFVSRQVEVELRDLDKLGQLLEKSFDLGVNQVGDPRLDSSKRRELEREALAKAVADARLNAEVVAKAAGARIGPPRTISASSGFSPPPMPMMKVQMARAEAADSAAGSYQSGQMGFNGTVQVEYDLIPLNP